MSSNPEPTSPALAGIRILDLGSVVFGPYCTQILADYGADVIKIESPEGDSTRYTGPAHERGRSAIFLGVNRNKRSVVLDLKRPEAREALLALVDTADVFIHSVRPQKLAKLGLDADTLRARNPRLVYVGLHGFGDGGPYSGQPAYDDIIQGMSGIADLMQRQSGTPAYFPTIAADKTCGQVAAHAVLAALFQRERTGRGQVVEVPMFETMASFVLVEHFFARHIARGAAQGAPGGGAGPDAAVPETGYPRVLAPWRRPYRTADGFVCMMPYTNAHWRAFFERTGNAGLAADPRFVDIAARTRNIAELYRITGEIVAARDTAHWLALCAELEIPAAKMNRLDDLERDPHLQAVGFFEELADEAGNHYRFTRNPVRLSDSEVPPALPPRLGEHTREVLAEAGLSADAIDRLVPDPKAA
ncbi:CoA transferase [Burkholderiaceae bacterium FT117]|uniref:CaiB/BaiF CoA transferase family protein n=1 Tax=Zeimonas sediminis TaxID=2944268 RepID=UPI0023431FD4|nr:CoA transferase [Zeimonas sediminis]MCM5569943.1 CoA transferase [Zeimonas sediminis]